VRAEALRLQQSHARSDARRKRASGVFGSVAAVPPDDQLAFTRLAAAIYAQVHGAEEVVNVVSSWALRMDVPFTVLTTEGPMRGYPGDYLMARGRDDAWPLKGEVYAATYRPVAAVEEHDGAALARALRNLLATVEHATMLNVDPTPFKRAVRDAHEALRAVAM
jgi:hypothetical protein